MTPELTVLALAALLQIFQICLMAVPANIELGPGETLKPRDGVPLDARVSVRTARLFRAMNNHFEALSLFAIAAVVVSISDQSTGFTAACAWTYLIARSLYIPAYAFGWVPWRSLIWSVGLLATALMLVAALI